MGADSLPYRVALGSVARQMELDRYLAMLAPAIAHYRTAPPPKAQAIFSLAQRQDDLGEIAETAQRWRQHFRTLLVVGAGGSGLSGKALSMLRCGAYLGNGHALHVLDNLDAYAMPRLLDALDLQKTCVLLVSKSGSTVETYAQSHAVLEAFRARGIHDFSPRVAAINMPGENPLRALAVAERIPIVDHDPELCGRFSMLAAPGLLPAAFMGLDIRKVRQGAAASLAANLALSSSASVGAALEFALRRQGCNMQVLIPYSEQLLGLALWWRQSWAESLGKEGQGTTPVVAMGTADQHSQLQLFLDGPDDKFYTLLLTDCGGKGMRLPAISGALSYLSGHTLGDLVAAQQRATAESLERKGRPLRVFEIGQADETAFGALLMHFTLEILFSAALVNANPFDQPAVEESKRLAHEYLLQGKAPAA